MLPLKEVEQRLEVVRSDKAKPVRQRAALYDALHDLYRHFAATANNKAQSHRPTTTTTTMTGTFYTEGAGAAEQTASATEKGCAYGSFAEVCAREADMDVRKADRLIKDALVKRLFCRVVLADDDDVGRQGDAQARSEAATEDRVLASKVSASSYRCLVNMVAGWIPREDWVGWSREHMEAWFSGPERRPLRRTMGSVWVRAKANAAAAAGGASMYPTREQFLRAYDEECASATASGVRGLHKRTTRKRKRAILEVPADGRPSTETTVLAQPLLTPASAASPSLIQSTSPPQRRREDGNGERGKRARTESCSAGAARSASDDVAGSPRQVTVADSSSSSSSGDGDGSCANMERRDDDEGPIVEALRECLARLVKRSMTNRAAVAGRGGHRARIEESAEAQELLRAVAECAERAFEGPTRAPAQDAGPLPQPSSSSSQPPWPSALGWPRNPRGRRRPGGTTYLVSCALRTVALTNTMDLMERGCQQVLDVMAQQRRLAAGGIDPDAVRQGDTRGRPDGGQVDIHPSDSARQRGDDDDHVRKE